MPTAYIAGPMTNRPNFNFDAFDAVAAHLRRVGWNVHNPHEHDQEAYPGIDEAEATKIGDVVGIAHEVGFDFHAAMAWDLARVAESDILVLLPEWETSTGARAERFVAEMSGSEVWLAYQDDNGKWYARTDDVQKRLVGPTLPDPDVEYVESRSSHTPKPAGEVRVVDPTTGGEKGAKPQAMHLLPGDVLLDASEHFKQGADKYAERNWERGYAWSLSYAALLRHLLAWWEGEDNDPEFGASHLRGVIFHAFALRAYELRSVGTDDRPAR